MNISKDIQIEIWDGTDYGTEWKSVLNDFFPNPNDRKVDWLNSLFLMED